MKPKTLAALVCYGSALALTVALGVVGSLRPWALERELFWLQASGWCAAGALLLALSATPVGRVLPRVRPFVSPFRRALGISAAALATLHGALALRTYLAGSLADLLDITWVRAGLIAWAILLPLWITSYPPLVEKLRVRAWKPLHRLAYVAAFFAFQHALLAPMAPRAWVLGVFGAALAVSALRLLARRRSGPPAPESGSP